MVAFYRRRRITAACTRPRASENAIVNLSLPQLEARRVMPGVRRLRDKLVPEVTMNRYDICGEMVLQILIDKTGRSFEELCDDFGMPPNSASHGLMELYYCLLALNEVGLITVDGYGDNKEAIYALIQRGVRSHTDGEKIRASDKWGRIRAALNEGHPPRDRISPYSMNVTPFFGQPEPMPSPPRLFVLMPFTDELKPIYAEHIIPVAKEIGLSVARADDFFTSKSIISDIWAAICKAEVIIADCTGRNPNVFYEIGMAHTIGKPVILITQKREDVPADLRHIRYIRYECSPEGMQIFREALKNTISSILQGLSLL